MKQFIADSQEYTLELQVADDVDLDGEFEALCLVTGETLTINGWLFTFEEIV